MSSPLILDGAMGTELQNRGVRIPLPLWSANANIEHPRIVMDIHREYIQAGCDILTTNTFRSTFWTYRKSGLGNLKSKELAKLSLYKAVECANEVATNPIKVAGSITTVDDCYTPGAYPGRSVAEDIYGQSIEWLLDAGINILLFETMGNIEEILCGLEMAMDHEITVWLSLIMKDESHILDNTPIQKVLELIKPHQIECIMTNCNQIHTTINSIESLRNNWDSKWGTYPNLSNSDYDNEYLTIIDESDFKNSIEKLYYHKPDVIGLCCGSTPRHINELTKLTKEIRAI